MKNVVSSVLLMGASLLFVSGCRPGESSSDADAMAVKRTTNSNGEFEITAQKPGDMVIKEFSHIMNPNVEFRTADGRTGEVSVVRNDEYFFIAVRLALADGVIAAMTGQAMRDVFLIPKTTRGGDPLISKAKSEGWQIMKIVSSPNSVQDGKGLRIYCPTRIEFKKKDGKPHVAEYPERSNCAGDISTLIGDVKFKK